MPHVTIKEIFEFHEKTLVYVEEWYKGEFFKRHFSFGFKDKDKGIIALSGDGGGPITMIDGNQKAWIDENPVFLNFKDKNGNDGKLKFFKVEEYSFPVAKGRQTIT